MAGQTCARGDRSLGPCRAARVGHRCGRAPAALARAVDGTAVSQGALPPAWRAASISARVGRQPRFVACRSCHTLPRPNPCVTVAGEAPTASGAQRGRLARRMPQAVAIPCGVNRPTASIDLALPRRIGRPRPKRRAGSIVVLRDSGPQECRLPGREISEGRCLSIPAAAAITHCRYPAGRDRADPRERLPPHSLAGQPGIGTSDARPAGRASLGGGGPARRAPAGRAGPIVAKRR